MEEKALDARIEKALPAWYEKTKKPIVRLQTTLEPVSKSRFGGQLGEAPLDENGKPLRLLAAIFCSEIHGVPDFPEKGVLRFYVQEEPIYGMHYEHPNLQKNWRVIYDPEEPDDLPAPHKEVITEFAIKGCFCLQPSEDTEPLAPPDYRFMDTFNRYMLRYGRFKPIDWDEYDAVKDRYPLRGNKIGGYMWSTQDDPRTKEIYRKYDTVLLQIDSNYRGDCQISFGDDGVALFLIPQEKLKARDFSDVMFWWDCY